MRGEVEPGHVEARVIRLDIAQKAAGAATDVEQPRPGAAHESGFERNQRLAPHGSGGTAEQHLDLMVVALGGGAAQIAVALKVELLQVIARIRPRFGTLVRKRSSR